MAALHRDAVNRQRRVIFNNDGDDHRLAGSVDDFLDLRTTSLAGTHVDTIFYSTARGTFNVFTHRTSVGQVVDNPSMHAFLERDTDPLQTMVDFCKANDIEIFWSFRVNDTHDAAWPPERFEAREGYHANFKSEHPDLLVGSRERPPVHGGWSAMDFAHREVRDRVVNFVEEVCRNYDIDGVDLDFFRHLVFFETVAGGQAAGAEEQAMMTEMVGRIREVLDREAEQRGRPLLLAVRTPDDLAYNKKLGLDLETWMREGWIDLFVPSGYFRLRPWEDSVELGRRYGVKVYAGLSESRITGYLSRTEARLLRQHPRSYRGRALNAWDAGVDGLYFFNLFNPQRPEWRQVGDPELLRTRDRDYFVSIRGEGSSTMGQWPYYEYIRVPVLNPDRPLLLHTGARGEARLRVGEDPRETVRVAPATRYTMLLAAPDLKNADYLTVTLNDTDLGAPRRDGSWWAFDTPPEVLRRGWNTVGFLWTGDLPPPEQAWDMEYRCDRLLVFPEQHPWRRAHSGISEAGAVEKIRDGRLLLVDRDSESVFGPHLIYPWEVEAGRPLVMEARLRVLGKPDPRAVCLRLADGRAAVFLNFLADGIELEGTGLRHAMDTTSAFHTYRVELSGDDAVVYVDGQEVIDGRGRFTRSATDPEMRVRLGWGLDHWNERSLYIGSASGPGQGEALWEFIRYRTPGPRPMTISDLMLRVEVE